MMPIQEEEANPQKARTGMEPARLIPCDNPHDGHPLVWRLPTSGGPHPLASRGHPPSTRGHPPCGADRRCSTPSRFRRRTALLIQSPGLDRAVARTYREKPAPSGAVLRRVSHPSTAAHPYDWAA